MSLISRKAFFRRRTILISFVTGNERSATIRSAVSFSVASIRDVSSGTIKMVSTMFSRRFLAPPGMFWWLSARSTLPCLIALPSLAEFLQDRDAKLLFRRAIVALLPYALRKYGVAGLLSNAVRGWLKTRRDLLPRITLCCHAVPHIEKLTHVLGVEILLLRHIETRGDVGQVVIKAVFLSSHIDSVEVADALGLNQ